MRQRAQAVEQLDFEDRRDQRPGEAEHDQQRGDVAEQQVLDHVHVQQVLAGRAERGERGGDRHEARVEAGLAPAGDGVAGGGERAHAAGVEQAHERQRAELQRGLDVGGDGERERVHASCRVRKRARGRWQAGAAAQAGRRAQPAIGRGVA